MGKPKVPNSKGGTDRQKKKPGTRSEEEPISPEANAKMDKKFRSAEEIPLKKKKKSVPKDSTAQRGKLPDAEK
ncbi:hypothetical protein FHG64_16780 [Antarcticibacterium flavum]|uniref:Uncharacterized protein n=1 Tax=Antarcticibacterium flavum TaxID=2058175 RepID=A0A5B7X8C9_9FLAO|nr:MULTISPECIES: hypothetical protein [Antarcticibacterium]MCM4159673.1 hypothetical protein [Antarcticibacterium sp. W02-3]QCY70913.1 hypothetical protein FHG64_16780 [Antarcticibacterium flavum]